LTLTRESEQLVAFLRDQGVVTQEQAEQAIAAESAAPGVRPITAILVDVGVSESALLASLAAAAGIDFVDLTEVQIDPTAISMVPEAMCRRLSCIPVSFDGTTIVVAMADPTNVLAKDDLRAVTRSDVRVVLATHADIEAAVNRFHRMDESFDTLTDEFGTANAGIDTVEDITVGADITDEAPVVKLANLLITQAVNDRASDIHIEPQERDVRVRFRIDGVLHEIMRSPKTLQAGLTSRMKIMADLDIAERRVPQSGRISVRVGNKPIDLRVETLPTVYGEKIVMRIIDKSTGLIEIGDLGFSKANLDRYLSACRQSYGAILVSGPTGSGKSTTLYATLNMLNGPERNIITVEDPVELRIAGVNQVQVHNKAGMTFASALRSILRADPDVVMVGEMRDAETATIGIQAALTGHLVLSTIHTNDAPSVLTRLVEMGVEPFLVASSIDCVVGQRLARKLCEKCKEPYEPSVDALREAGWPHLEALTELPMLYRRGSCASCAKTGYRGRVAVHEVMLVNEEIERLCAERVGSEDIKKLAIAEGMITLREDALLKAYQGVTSLEEVVRVTV
jgi:type IV pilus assembly protein PilB